MKKVRLENGHAVANGNQLPEIDVYEVEEMLGRLNREVTREYLEKQNKIIRCLQGVIGAALVLFSLSKMYQAWSTQDEEQSYQIGEEDEVKGHVVCMLTTFQIWLLASAVLAGIALLKKNWDLESIDLHTSRFVEQITPCEFKHQTKQFSQYSVETLTSTKKYKKYEAYKMKSPEDDFMEREAATISKLEDIEDDSELLEGVLLKIDEEQKKRAPMFKKDQKNGGDSLRSSIEPVVNGVLKKPIKRPTQRAGKQNQDDQLTFSYNSEDFR